MRQTGRYEIKALEKALRILELFDEKGKELTATQIHQLLRLNKSTVFRILRILEEANCLERNAETLRYQLGFKLYHLGIPGQVKCFIDRLGNSLSYYFSELFSKEPVFQLPRLMKVVGSISQGSHLFAGQEHAQAFINTHAVLMRCIPVSGDLWESYLGAGGWTEVSPKVNAMKTLVEEGKLDAQLAVRSAQSLGKRVVEMAMIVKSGLIANESLLAEEPSYRAVLKKIKGERP